MAPEGKPGIIERLKLETQKKKINAPVSPKRNFQIPHRYKDIPQAAVRNHFNSYKRHESKLHLKLDLSKSIEN